jgi:hypothetical protein
MDRAAMLMKQDGKVSSDKGILLKTHQFSDFPISLENQLSAKT